ncbi:MAG TPA: type III pantothenate kinase [Dehalococcoidia bacterium]|jgi:type III pantothenate kinase|nr:type III pantothenate kinase [Dehalococcoidia bacterium]HIL32164.1 type III pantothenate kinase [Dehalococcoidia bacterium]
MLLAVDIGNSMVNLGVFDGETLVANLRVSTDARRSSDEYGLMIRDLLALNGVERSTITDVCMCSVVPPLTGIFEEVSETYFHIKPLSITAGVKTGLQISYDNPRDVGADRIVDAVAAINLYGKPVIVVDFGTATVFDAISRDGIYLGGAIAPGINVAAEALFLNTSQLRRVELVAPKSAIGQNTSTALQAGLVLGYAGLVTGLVERFKSELGPEAKVIGTGGLATIISKEADVFDDINQDLTLIGLRMIYNMNQTQAK